MWLFIQYYALPEKLENVGRQDDVKKLNRTALGLAREVAHESGCIFAGDIGGTTVYVPEDPKSHDLVKNIFEVILYYKNVYNIKVHNIKSTMLKG